MKQWCGGIVDKMIVIIHKIRFKKAPKRGGGETENSYNKLL